MNGWRCTITGADDQVDPTDLLRFSDEFPFVEWAILVSTGKRGEPRYPSIAWQERLREVAAVRPMHVAVHVCGGMARRGFLREGLGFVTPLDKSVTGRVQINGAALEELASWQPQDRIVEHILQARSEAEMMPLVQVIRRHPDLRMSLLADGSGGRGIEPFAWPRPPAPDVVMGYAGGIRPENVASVLEDITLATAGLMLPTWIDLETGARDDRDQFDLGRVRRVLEVVASTWPKAA